MKKIAILISLLCAPALVFGQGGLDPTDIWKPLRDQWASYSGDLSGKRFSALKMVNTNTVKSLSLKWVSSNITTGCGRRWRVWRRTRRARVRRWGGCADHRGRPGQWRCEQLRTGAARRRHP